MSVSIINTLDSYSTLGGSPLLTDLTGYWQIDESGGSTLYNEIGANVDLSTDATLNQSGIIGTSASIGSGQSIDLPYDSTVNFHSSTWSISFWLYINNTASTLAHNVYLIYARDDTYSFGVRFIQTTSNYYSIILKNSSASEYYSDSSSAITTTGSWMHFVIVFRGSGYTTLMYLNNSNITAGWSTSFSGSMLQNGSYTCFGNANTDGTSLYMDGRIDEIGIWSRELSSDEVSDLYNSGSGLTYPFS